MNLLPHLAGESRAQPHAALFWRFSPQRAVRRGSWKPVDWRNFEAKTNRGWQLCDLAQDPGECVDFAAARPEFVAKLAALWETWNRDNSAPLWRGTPNEDTGASPIPPRQSRAAGKLR